MRANRGPALSGSQKKSIEQMQEILGLIGQDDFCRQLLAKMKWDLNAAVQQFYDQDMAQQLPQQASQRVDPKKAEVLFNKYATKSGEMGEDEIERFYSDLGVDSSTDIVTLIISMYMGAKKMGTYEKSEFLEGCKTLGVDSIDAWKSCLPRLYKEL